MQDVLTQLNAVPGVNGTLLCDADGRLLAKAFPPHLSGAALAEAAKVLAESTAGLATVTGDVRMLDLRYGNARVVVRPVGTARLLFLCAPSVNLQPLTISATVAGAKLEKLLASNATGAEAAPAPGQLYTTLQRINAVIERKKLDPFKARGEIAMKAGFGLGFIDPGTPDDPKKLAALRAAATAVLGERV
jgi:predicted regulator of Ras-like GTPase activity (Roadblock/LC7/MglB family)